MYLRKLLPFILAFVVFLFVSFFTATSAANPSPLATDTPDTSLLFIENVGQFGDGARYQVRGGGSTLWLAQDALWITQLETTTEPSAFPTHGVNLRLSFPGATPNPRLEPFDPLPTTISYFSGNDPAKWRSDVPVWGGVRYVDLYPGIDLELSGASGQFQPRLVVHSPEALDQVRLKVEGAEGITVHDGAIEVSSAIGNVTFPLLEVVAPDGSALPISTVPMADDTEILLPFGSYSAQGQGAFGGGLSFSTYLGYSDYEEGRSVAVDSAGNIYVTGMTLSIGFPTTFGVFDSTANGTHDGFVSKFSNDGSMLLYSSYLGGPSHDVSKNIAVDDNGNVYLTGYTESATFPITPNAIDTSYNGGHDVFVTQLNASGNSLVYSTFLGGTGEEEGGEIVVDGAGKAYITGPTFSANYPTTAGVVDTTYNGEGDIFVTALNASGDALGYSTFIGGMMRDEGWGLALDGGGNVYVTGFTDSPNFPVTTGAYDTSYNQGGDGFITKINPMGSVFIYSTYLGSGLREDGSALAVDATGSTYITGYTYSPNFPISIGAYDTTHNGGIDVYLSKLNPAGTALEFSTFLGAPGQEDADDIAIDANGNTYISGYTTSTSFPTTPNGFDPTFDGITDGFVAKFNSNATVLLYSSYFGGPDYELIFANAIDAAGILYFIGLGGVDYPTTAGTYDPTYNGSLDVVLTKLETTDMPPTPTPTETLPPTLTSTPTPIHTPTVTPTLVPDAPEISIAPAKVYEVHLISPQTTTTTVTIQNAGALTLTWTITDTLTSPGRVLTTAKEPFLYHAPVISFGGAFSFGTSGIAGETIVHRPNVAQGELFITHSATQNITPLNSVACNAGGGHADNAYYRVFDLAEDFGITQTLSIDEVSFGIEQADSVTDSQPATVNLYTLSGPFVLANLTPIGSETISIPESATGTVLNVPFAPEVIVPANNVLVVELFTPNGQPAGNHFLIGSNADPETALSYIRAPDCGVPEPIPTGALGYPTMHMVLNVSAGILNGGNCATPTDIPWLTVSPTTGNIAGGESTPITLSFDSSDVPYGVYQGLMCITSNDPDEPLIPIPVTFNVETPPTAIDLNAFQAALPAIPLVDIAVATTLLFTGILLWRRHR